MTLPQPVLPGDEAAVEQGMKSSLMVPLVTQGQVVGLLVLYRRRPFAFQHGDATDLAPISDYLAQLLLWRRLRGKDPDGYPLHPGLQPTSAAARAAATQD